MKTRLTESLTKTKKASLALAVASAREKSLILLEIARELQKSKSEILRENAKDILRARKNKLSSAFVDRLDLSGDKLAHTIKAVKEVAKLPDPCGELIEKKKLANGVILRKVRVPLGVIGIIYESRPNVTVDAAILAIKSGNGIVLKGGSDALMTNSVLVRCIERALETKGFSPDSVLFLNTSDRKVVDNLLRQSDLVDVLIPRGGYELVKKVALRSRIPVLYHAEGGARIYVDSSAPISRAIKICMNAKTSRPGVCNALDTIVVHRDIAPRFLKEIEPLFISSGVEVRGDREACKLIKALPAREKDYHTEFLDLVVSIKVVENVTEAIQFINDHSNRHSEGIIAKSRDAIWAFTEQVDAAALFVNCSTRLHDGGVFEMGAEMGIATGKLHARGPVGLTELTTYKWIACGGGQLRT